MKVEVERKRDLEKRTFDFAVETVKFLRDIKYLFPRSERKQLLAKNYKSN